MHRIALIVSLLGSGLNLNANSIVGTLPGDVVVSNTGAAIYTVSISLPAGVAGMAPELAIQYDSSSGNGLLGMGFRLDGLSAITRTPTTLEQDGFRDGIDFDENDRFALDGHRLVCVSGDYGSVNSEYRTEIDSFARITAHGSASSGLDYFVVETKSGLTKTYGLSYAAAMIYDVNDADLNPSDGAKITWLLEKIEDTSGNAISYSYVKDANTQIKYISEITYGALGHLLKVSFEYGDRVDQIPSYLHGLDFKTTQRIDKIRVWSGGNEIGNYALEYDYSPQRTISRLRSLTYKDVATNHSMTTSFDWGDTVAIQSFEEQVDWLPDAESGEGYIREVKNGDTLRDLVDVNGDGLPDRVEGLNYETDAPGMWVRLNNGSGFDSAVLWFHSSKTEQNRVAWKSDGDTLSRLIDMNGDSLPDKVDHRNYDVAGNPYGIWVSLNTGCGFDYANKSNWLGFSPTHSIHTRLRYVYFGDIRRDLIDMNDDGLPDRVENAERADDLDEESEGPGMWVRLNNGSGFDSAALWYLSSKEEQNRVQWNSDGDNLSRLIDMNGDGLPDRVDHRNYELAGDPYGIWVSLNTGTGFDYTNKSNWLGFSPTDYINHTRLRDMHVGDIRRDLIDMNGDGLPDRVEGLNQDRVVADPDQESGAPGMWVRLNNGSGFDSAALWYLSSEHEQNRVQWDNDGDTLSRLMDINGDGLPDKVDHRNYGASGKPYGLWVSINNGSGFEPKVSWYDANDAGHAKPKSISSGSIIRDLVDMNGDGRPDRVEHRNYENGDALGFWVSLNNGAGFDAAVSWLFSEESGLHEVQKNSSDGDLLTQLADINGDGFLDKIGDGRRVVIEYKEDDGNEIGYKEVTTYGLFASINKAVHTHLVKVTDQLGVVTEIAYKPLTDSSVYEKGTHDATPPAVTIQKPLRVVSSVTKDAGINDSNGNPIPYVTEYSYTEGRFHVRGRGFLGFRVFESHDVQTGLTKAEILRQDFPYTGMKQATLTYGPNGQLLAHSKNELGVKALNSGSTFFPYFISSEEWRAGYDASTDFSRYTEQGLIDHLETNAYGHTLTKNTMDDGQGNEVGAFDAHGNLLRVFIDYGDGYTQETLNEYDFDNETTWFLGRLSGSTVHSTAPDRAP